MSRKARLLIAFAFAAALGVFLLGSALAQTAPAADQGGAANYRELFLDRLAAILGVDRTRLDAAVKQAGGDVIAQAEQDGRLSKNQADRMRQFLDKGAWPVGPWFGHGRGFHGHGWFKGWHGAWLDAAANALGMSPDELTAEFRNGKTLGEVADARGVDRQKVQDAIVAAESQGLDEAVRNGDLTREQADKILERFKSLNLMDRPLGPCPGRGWRVPGKTVPQSGGTSSAL